MELNQIRPSVLQLAHALVAVLFVAGAATGQQLEPDTASVYRALARALESGESVEKYTVVQWAGKDTELSELLPWLDSLAAYLNTSVTDVDTRYGPLPPCPWGAPYEAGIPIGYTLKVGLPKFEGDSASVDVTFVCRNPERYHQNFERGDRFYFKRDDQEWLFVSKFTFRITSITTVRDLRSLCRTPRNRYHRLPGIRASALVVSIRGVLP